jgi:hypothetical protein
MIYYCCSADTHFYLFMAYFAAVFKVIPVQNYLKKIKERICNIMIVRFLD